MKYAHYLLYEKKKWKTSLSFKHRERGSIVI